MEKYFEMLEKIKNEKIDINKLFLLDNLHNSNKDLAIKQMNYCYDLWLDADLDMSLDRLADIVRDNWSKIENNELTDTEIIEICVSY